MFFNKHFELLFQISFSFTTVSLFTAMNKHRHYSILPCDSFFFFTISATSDGAFAICRELGIKQEECLYLGDTNTDMETGLNAGMDTVGVLWGFRNREELEGCHPQYIVAHPSEVAEIVKKKNVSIFIIACSCGLFERTATCTPIFFNDASSSRIPSYGSTSFRQL